MFRLLLPLLAAGAQSPADDHHSQMLAWTNQVRAYHGLPAATLSDKLAEAAGKHATWMSKNGFGHYQNPGTPGFLGVSPDERARAVGYRGPGVWENVAAWRAVNMEYSPMRSLEQLFGVPYHRKLFLAPGPVEIGFGLVQEVNGPSSKGHLAVSAAPASPKGVIISPYDGQKDVILEMPGRETPDPLRIHPKRDVGYPIMLLTYGSGELKFKSASLTTGGKDVPIFVNHSGNDEHSDDCIIVFPQDELKPGTTYRASVSGTLENGWLVSRDWTFTTRPDED